MSGGAMIQLLASSVDEENTVARDWPRTVWYGFWLLAGFAVFLYAISPGTSGSRP